MISPEQQLADFDAHRPTFTGEQAEAAFRSEGLVVSADARKGLPDLFVVKFATKEKGYVPISLTRVAAENLRQLLGQHGF
jgi:hypothetical protein